MLEGITVLNQTNVMELPDWFNICFVAGTILAIIFIMVGIFTIDGKIGPILTITALVMFAALMVMSWFETAAKVPTGRYQYECTIDESVSMTEVYERYEVIEQRGDIWVLEDKE